MPEPQGWKNTYTCNRCGESIVTVNVVEGTTPMYMSCKATDGCEGTSVSEWGRFAPDAVTTHEWYLPDERELVAASRDVVEHVRMGGLLLRPVS